MNQKKIVAYILPCLVFLSACQHYSISLNDKRLYTPSGPFRDYQITDVALANCVSQTIVDEKIISAEELTKLNCSNAGIKSLDGLDKFFALTELNLSNNQITDINELNQLGRLDTLLIEKNQITQVAPLLNLLHLRRLDLSHNPVQDCADLEQLQKNLAYNKTIFVLTQVCQ